MLDWKKASVRPNTPFVGDELEWDGYTPDGFFYRLGCDDALQLMDNNVGGAIVINTRCVKNDPDRRFRLYTSNQDEWSLNRCPPAKGYGPKRWYFVNRLTQKVYVANNNGETIKKAIEGTEVLL